MAQDELHIFSRRRDCCGGGVSSGKRSRNVKQKKLPQRGLGIAQLEKMRLEEERRKRKSHINLGGGVSSERSRNVKKEKVAGLGVAQLEKMRLDEEREKESLDSVNHRLSNGDYYNNLAVNSAAALRFFHFHQAASPVVNFSFLSSASAVNVDGKNCAWTYNYKMVGVKREYPFSHFDPSSVATKSRNIYPNPRDNLLSLAVLHSELAADANGEAIDLNLKL